MSGSSHSNQLILEISFSLYQRFCLLESKVRKTNQSITLICFEARNMNTHLFYIKKPLLKTRAF